MSAPARRTLFACVVLAAGAYAASVTFQFAYDDIHLVLQNDRLHSLANWRAMLSQPWWEDAMYRPLTALTLALDWVVSGGRPAWFHAVNVLLHAAATGLVFALARPRLGVAAGGVAAAIFAVHPVHVEAVANVVGRAEVLATIFTLVAVLAYRWDGVLADRGDRASPRRALASFGVLASLVCAFASKESAFAAPALLLLSDWWDAAEQDRSLGSTMGRHAVLWVAATGALAAWLWIWVSVVGGLSTGGTVAPGLAGADLVGRMAVMAGVVPEYLRLFFAPIRLSADYSPEFLSASPAVGLRDVLGMVIVVGALAAAWLARRAQPSAAVAVAWMVAALLVVSNLVVPTEVLLAERTLYLPSVGAALLMGWGFARVAQRRWQVAVGAAAVVVSLGLLRTVTRAPVWRSNATLFPQLVADAPGSFRSYWVAGGLAVERGDTAEGERLMREAIVTYPLHPTVWSDLAGIVEGRRRWREAATLYAAASRLDPERVEYAARSAQNFVRAGFPDSARAMVEAGARVAPRHPLIWVARADIAAASGRHLEAMTWRRQLAWRYPGDWRFWALTVESAIAAQHCPEVQRGLERLEALAPDQSATTFLGRRAGEVCPPE